MTVSPCTYCASGSSVHMPYMALEGRAVKLGWCREIWGESGIHKSVANSSVIVRFVLTK